MGDATCLDGLDWILCLPLFPGNASQKRWASGPSSARDSALARDSQPTALIRHGEWPRNRQHCLIRTRYKLRPASIRGLRGRGYIHTYNIPLRILAMEPRKPTVCGGGSTRDPFTHPKGRSVESRRRKRGQRR